MRGHPAVGDIATTDVKPSELATVQLPSGFTYTFFYDQGTNPATLKYLYGPSDGTTYSVRAVQVVDANTAVINSKPSALAATLQSDDIHLFYAKDDLTMQHLVFNFAPKTWKVGSFVSNAIAPSTGISAVGDPVLKVHFVDATDQKTITEAYYTEGTWTTRKLAN